MVRQGNAHARGLLPLLWKTTSNLGSGRCAHPSSTEPCRRERYFRIRVVTCFRNPCASERRCFAFSKLLHPLVRNILLVANHRTIVRLCFGNDHWPGHYHGFDHYGSSQRSPCRHRNLPIRNLQPNHWRRLHRGNATWNRRRHNRRAETLRYTKTIDGYNQLSVHYASIRLSQTNLSVSPHLIWENLRHRLKVFLRKPRPPALDIARLIKLQAIETWVLIGTCS
jgi:hypothetical protein